MKLQTLSIRYADNDELILRVRSTNWRQIVLWEDVVKGSPYYIDEVIEELGLLQIGWGKYFILKKKGDKFVTKNYDVVSSGTLRRPLPQRLNINCSHSGIERLRYCSIIPQNELSLDWVLAQIEEIGAVVWGEQSVGQRIEFRYSVEADRIFRRIEMEKARDLA